MQERAPSRCSQCQAPIQFRPGAGSRLCPFCNTINLVREQTVAVPSLELQIDQVFALIQGGQAQQAVQLAQKLQQESRSTPRLEFYRALALLETGKTSEAVYALIDLTGEEASQPLRADFHALLGEALHSADRNTEALEAVEKALQIMPGHPAAALTRAHILLQAGKLGEAARLVEQTLETLAQPWKISLPPSPARGWILLAHIYGMAERPRKVIEALENLLVRDSGADLAIVAEALVLLGWNTLKVEPHSESALEFIRLGALIDTDNQHGALQLLQAALEKGGGDMGAELAALQAKRDEGLAEIRQVMSLVSSNIDITQIEPRASMKLLGEEPDRRVDILQQAADRLKISTYDRGTLYPLKDFESFRRWLVAWRARNYLVHIKHEQLERQRKNKLMAVHQVQQARAAGKEIGRRLKQRRQRTGRRLKLWLLATVVAVLAGVAIFLAVYGDLLLDSFSGRLLRIDCRPDSACSLVVDTGAAGEKRYQRRFSSSAWQRLFARWLDQRVGRDGLVTYPLDLPCSSPAADDFRPCLGKTIHKHRFHLLPVCGGRAGRQQ